MSLSYLLIAYFTGTFVPNVILFPTDLTYTILFLNLYSQNIGYIKSSEYYVLKN